MAVARRSPLCVFAISLYLAWPLPLLSAEHTPAPPYPGWHVMPWPGLWWIFPLLFFLVMIVMFIFFLRAGGPWCMWHRMMGWPNERDARRGLDEYQSESALEILNKRYARGELDKKEYEEKRSAITRPD